MSMISELISTIGVENIQGLVAVVLTALVGKSSWDVYKSREVANKSDVNASGAAMKVAISAVSDAISEVKDKHVRETHDRIEKLENEFKASNKQIDKLETELEKLAQKIEKLEQASEKTPGVSRAEIRRMKESRS